VQCQYCGNIYYVEQEIPIDAFIVDLVCPECGYTRALNCGENKEDIYLYMNENVDYRYYLY
jgi:hypothetical protein